MKNGEVSNFLLATINSQRNVYQGFKKPVHDKEIGVNSNGKHIFGVIEENQTLIGVFKSPNNEMFTYLANQTDTIK